MTPTPVDLNDEQQRIEALRGLDILDTPQEQEYDELVQLASEICDAPISLVSLVDSERQWFKAAVGVAAKETHRNVSFCSHAIQKPEIFIVEDATNDERFRDNALVTGELGVRFYAGVPLHAPSGHAIGALCVIDRVPRTLTDSQKNALVILGRQVKARMELRQKQSMLERAVKANEELLATLRDRHKLFSAFMNNGPFISYIKDHEGKYIYLNDLHRDHFKADSDAWIGRTDLELFATPVGSELQSHDQAVLAGGVPVLLFETTPNDTGKFTHWKSYKFPLSLENGNLLLAGMSIDVTEEHRRKEELDRTTAEKLELAASLERSTVLMKTFIDNNPNVCYFKDEDGRYLSYNSKFAELFEIGTGSWVGKNDHDVRPAEIADRVREQDLMVLSQDEVLEATNSLRTSDGHLKWFKRFIFGMQTPDGKKILAGVALDVTHEIEREQALSEANAQLELLATTDPLTGLSNRRVFEERIAVEFSNAVRKKRSMSLLLMDIDNFKRRNDTFGHAAGDDALRLLGAVLRESLRLSDTAARIGGEEFALILPDSDSVDAASLAERIQCRLRCADLGPTPLTVSVGIATVNASHPLTTENWKRLLSCADAAMYDAKKAGKDCFVIHQPQGLSLHDLIGF